MAVSVPAIKISAVATTLMSISVKMAITRATPRSVCRRFFCAFTVSSLVRIKAHGLAVQRDGTVLMRLRVGLQRTHHQGDIHFTNTGGQLRCPVTRLLH